MHAWPRSMFVKQLVTTKQPNDTRKASNTLHTIIHKETREDTIVYIDAQEEISITLIEILDSHNLDSSRTSTQHKFLFI